MPNCEHSCCKECATKHFTILVKDKNISEATCPFCQEPTGLADDDDLAANYFAKLDVLLKPLVEQDVSFTLERILFHKYLYFVSFFTDSRFISTKSKCQFTI